MDLFKTLGLTPKQVKQLNQIKDSVSDKLESDAKAFIAKLEAKGQKQVDKVLKHPDVALGIQLFKRLIKK